MSSQKQIDANRRNAQKSTGPQTPGGRAAIRFNALRHGLTAENAVLDNENPQDFQEMLEAFQAEHQPAGPTENLLVHQLVMAAWRLQRLRGIETGLFDLRMHELSKLMDLTRDGMEENQRQAFVFFDDSRNACAIQNLVRYETRIERSFYRALHELQRLRATREPAPHPDDPIPASDPPAPDPADHDPTTAQPEPSTQVTNSAKQSHSQNRTPSESAAARAETRMAVATGASLQPFHVSLLDTMFKLYPEEACRA